MRPVTIVYFLNFLWIKNTRFTFPFIRVTLFVLLKQIFSFCRVIITNNIEAMRDNYPKMSHNFEVMSNIFVIQEFILVNANDPVKLISKGFPTIIFYLTVGLIIQLCWSEIN